MRRIALYISTIVLLCGCKESDIGQKSGQVSIVYLQSMATERSQLIKQDIYVEGYVVANDKLQEIEHAIVIDDSTAGIELKVDCEYIEDIVPLFSHVRLRCTGLHIGREGAKLVIGAPPTAEYVVDRLADKELLNVLSFTNREPTPKPRDISIATIESRMVLSYVHIRDLAPIESDYGKMWCDIDSLNNNENVTTLRHLPDGRDTIAIITSERCQYAAEYIPTARFSATGIIDWGSGDYALRLTSYQITEQR